MHLQVRFSSFVLLALLMFCITGTGDMSFGGDGGPATSASFDTPSRIRGLTTGVLYLSDAGSYIVGVVEFSNEISIGNNRVRKISISGRISTFAGTGDYNYNGDLLRATSTSLDAPNGVTISPVDYSVYITEEEGCRFRVVDHFSGKVTLLAGQGNQRNRRQLQQIGDEGLAVLSILNAPSDSFIDTNGLIYLADSSNFEVRVLTSNVPTVSPTMFPSDAPSLASFTGTVNGDQNTENLGQGVAVYETTALIAGHYQSTKVVFVFQSFFGFWSYTAILSEFDGGSSLSDDVSLAVYDTQAFVGDPNGLRGAGKFSDL